LQNNPTGSLESTGNTLHLTTNPNRFTQYLIGDFAGSRALNDVVISGNGIKTFRGVASTTDFSVSGNVTVNMPARTTVRGDYTTTATTSYAAGTAWEDITLPSDTAGNNWADVTYGNGRFVAVARTGTQRVMYSDDGVNWSTSSVPVLSSWRGVTYGNGTFVAVADGGTWQVIRSADGINWATSTIPEGNWWQSVAYGAGLFVAVAENGTNRIMTSPDGVTWTARLAPNSNAWTAVTFGSSGFVAVAFGSSANRVMVSATGTSWTAHSILDDDDIWRSITFGNGRYVAVGYFGQLAWSTNGTSWTQGYSIENTFDQTGVLQDWDTVTFGEGLFVAGSQSGSHAFLTSPDGATWTPRGGLRFYAVGLAYGGGAFVSVAEFGTPAAVRSVTATTTFGGSSSQTLAGSLTGTSTLGNVAFQGAGTKTFSNNASTSNFFIQSGSGNVNAPSHLTIAGDFDNRSVFNAGSGTTTFGSEWRAQQVASGTMTGTSDFTNLAFTGSSTKLFVTAASTTNLLIASTSGEIVLPPRLSVAGQFRNGEIERAAGTDWATATPAQVNSWQTVAYGNGTFVALASDGTNAVMTSSDGVTWTARSAAGNNDYWRSVTFGNGRFVAVADSAGDKVMTSLDGITWATTSAVGDNDSWTDVTFGNNLFVAVGHAGIGDAVMTSPDGLIWTARAAVGTDDTWRGVTYGNGRFVAVGNNGDRVMYSDTGTTWATTTAAGNDDGWAKVAYGNGLFVAVGDTGADRVMTSPDGISWTAQSVLSNDDIWTDVSYGNGLFVAVAEAGDRVATSPDGVTWTAVAAAGNNDGWSSVAYGNDRFVAVAYSGTDRVLVSTSTIGGGAPLAAVGSQWATSTPTANELWITVAYGNGRFVALGASGPNRVNISDDGGVSWTGHSGPADGNFWTDIEYANGTFVAVAIDGTGNNRIATSPDGIAWTYRNGRVANSWYQVEYGNGRFVALSNDGSPSVIYSTDNGATWATTTHPAATWGSLAFGAGRFVAVSAQNSAVKAMVSVDGVTWATGTAPTTGFDDWDGLEYGNGRFVAVNSYGGYSMVSGDGIQWTLSLPNAVPEGEFWTETAYGGGQFVVIANGATNTVMTSLDGLTWTVRQPAARGGYEDVAFGADRFVAVGDSAPARFMVSNRLATTTFTGASAQVATGTLSGVSGLGHVEVTNTGTTTFAAPLAVRGNLAVRTPAATVAFSPQAETLVEGDLTLVGTPGTAVELRSGTAGVQAPLRVLASTTVTYADIKDSAATSTNGPIYAADGTSVDGGNNTGWNFGSSQSVGISSAANQVFAVGFPTTTISALALTDGVVPAITSANDIRIRIATSSVTMRWDTTDTTATLSGTAAGKVSPTVTYENGGTTLVLNVTSNFTSGDTLIVSDLSYAQFASVTAATSALTMYIGGAGDTTVDAVDDKTITVTGALTLAEHPQGQVSNAFTATNRTQATLFRHRVTTAGETMNVATTTFTLRGIGGIVPSDLSNLVFYRDVNSDGAIDGGDTVIASTGTMAMSGQIGTISFRTPYIATGTRDYLFVADLSLVRPGDQMEVWLNTTSLTATGSILGVTVPVSGLVSRAQHERRGAGTRGVSGAEEIGGAPPAGQGDRGGGSTGGGSGEIDTNTGGAVLGDTPGRRAPGSTGSPQGAWTNGANGYTSDGVYATTGTGGARQSYGTFGFALPFTNTISGIEVFIEGSATQPGGTLEARLSWNGTALTGSKVTPTLTTSDTIYTLGGPADTWGRSWTPSEFTDGNFVLEITGQPAANTVQIDAIRVEVYHFASGGGGGGGGEVRRPTLVPLAGALIETYSTPALYRDLAVALTALREALRSVSSR
jgi:hypothetical protein